MLRRAFLSWIPAAFAAPFVATPKADAKAEFFEQMTTGEQPVPTPEPVTVAGGVATAITTCRKAIEDEFRKQGLKPWGFLMTFERTKNGKAFVMEILADDPK